MDSSLHLYISSKSSFLESIQSGNQELNSFVIGLVFSCNQSEIQSKFELLEILFTIISLKREDIQTAGILKFLQECQNYLKSYRTSISYISELFCKFCKYISELKFAIPQIEVFSQEFSRTAEEFVGLFCQDDIFAIMLKAVFKNRPLLKCYLAQVSDDLIRKIDELSKIHVLADLNEFYEVLEATCRLVDNEFNENMRNFSNFILFKLQKYLKHHQSEDLAKISQILAKHSKIFLDEQIKEVKSELSKHSFGSLLIDSQLKLKNPESKLNEDPNTAYIKSGQASKAKSPDPISDKMIKIDPKSAPKASLIKVSQKPYEDEPIIQEEKKTESFFDTYHYGKVGQENHSKFQKREARNYEESKGEKRAKHREMKDHGEKDKFFEKNDYKQRNYVKKNKDDLPQTTEPVKTDEKPASPSPEKEEIKTKPEESSNSTAHHIKIKPKSYEDDDIITDHQASQSSKSLEIENPPKPELEIKNLINKLLQESLNSSEKRAESKPEKLSKDLKELSRYPGFKKTLYLEIINLMNENPRNLEKVSFWEEVANVSESFIEKHQVETIRKKFIEGQRSDSSTYNRRGRGMKK